MQVFSCSRYSALAEFSKEERQKWFSLTERKVLPHIDTLYYTVSIKYDDAYNPPKEVTQLINELDAQKKTKRANMSSQLYFFDLEVMATGFSIYEYRLSYNETFDIFIGKYLPNISTPRIVVQLRSRSLVLDGVDDAVLKSFEYVRILLDSFGLTAGEVRENRIDYAYHTNLIQNPYRFFRDEALLKHFISNMRIGQKVFRIRKEIELDYIAFGNRKSNNIYFRCYNKSAEVIEKNYKSFFIDRWLEHRLISEYDAYCYRVAFSMKSYRTGLIIGRIRWYLEHGKDPELKRKLTDAIQNCHVESDNNDFLEETIKPILPPVTLVMNAEFETKRRFYTTIEETHIASHVYTYDGDPALERLMKVLHLQGDIMKYLTSESVAFVIDREIPKEKQVMCDWWRRIHRCRIPYSEKQVLEFYRAHDRETDLKRARTRLQSSIAAYNIISRQQLDRRSFEEDISDVLCALNDNDFYGFSSDESGQPVVLESQGYEAIQARKARQYRGVVRPKISEESPEKPPPDQSDPTNEQFTKCS